MRPPWIRRHLDRDGRWPARDEVGPFRPLVWWTLAVVGLGAVLVRVCQ